MKNEHLKNWEISLLLALCVTLCASCWAGGRSAAIAGSLVRLHVIADSDDEYEQSLKLRVRDSVLECLTPLLDGAEDAGEARDIIARSLPEVRRAAEGAAEGRAVAVELSREGYPTREYGAVTLPAGVYDSLRVTLGAGEGRNWWCVVFPPLCASAAGYEQALAALGENGELLTAGGEVEIRFRLVELWGEFLAWIESLNI